jgi:catechol 2,3-dioxygenase-like lactoylglutathione lyase family enzyme
MPAITDKSPVKEPLLKMLRMNHGTLDCNDIAKTRKFYEEVLGMECIQTSPISMMVRHGTEHIYAVVEVPKPVEKPMSMMNHNGFEVATPEEVDAAHEKLKAIKDEWGLRKIMPIQKTHGDHTFYFMDFDGNWWEIVSVRKGGYVADFDDKENYDMTGRHEASAWVEDWVKNKKLHHTHDPEVRAKLKEMAGK